MTRTHSQRAATSIKLIFSLALALQACGSEPEPSKGTDDDADESPSKDDNDDNDDPPVGKDKPKDAGKPPAKAADAGTKPPAVDNTPTPAKDGGTPSVTPPANTAPFCEVLQIVQTKCNDCHGADLGFGAPMSLTKHAEFVANAPVTKAKKVYEEIGVRIHDKARPMPPKDYPVLTADELAKIDGWIKAGAPDASDGCNVDTTPKPGTDVPVTDWPADCEEKHKFLANDNGQPHSVPANYEGYVDFTFQVPWKESVQAVAFRPTIDNKKVLHHWILYQGANAFLNGWSPGKPEKTLPTDVGVHMPASGTLKMTVHYNNKSAGAKTEKDNSGVEVCVTRTKRKNTAFTYPFTASATAPAGRMVSNVNTCTVQTSLPEIHLVTSSPHMHKLGVAAKFEVIHADGTTEVITDKPFNFEEQTDEVIDVVVKNGDKISTTCTYKNDGNATVSFGQNTDQEMCFNFSLYYPMCGMRCTGGDPIAAAISSSQGGGCPPGATVPR
jgi:mono/diheme cytochrome c family protein